MLKKFRRWLANIILAVGTFVTGDKYYYEADRLFMIKRSDGTKHFYHREGWLERIEGSCWAIFYDKSGQCIKDYKPDGTINYYDNGRLVRKERYDPFSMKYVSF